jgi:Protein of unknown function (DUF2905)
MVSVLGRWLMWIGGGLLLVGLALHLLGRLPWAGRLPGDIVVHRGNFTLYAPLGTMILVSLLLTLVLNLILRLRR